MSERKTQPKQAQLDAAEVAEWLAAHPDFFVEHASLLARLRIPHGTGGNSVSLIEKQVAAGKEFLQRASGAPVSSNFDEVRMESLEIPVGSNLHDRTLAEAALGKAYGLQVAGINRAGGRILNPRGEEKLFAGDSLLVLGSPDQIATFKASLRG